MPDVFDVLAKDHGELQRKLAEFERDPALAAASVQDALVLRKKMAEALIIEESGHEAREEMYFWPAVRERVTGGDALADKAADQERERGTILDKLEATAAWDPEFETLLASFIRATREHFRFEETVVWPRAFVALPPQEAAELGVKIAGDSQTA